MRFKVIQISRASYTNMEGYLRAIEAALNNPPKGYTTCKWDIISGFDCTSEDIRDANHRKYSLGTAIVVYEQVQEVVKPVESLKNRKFKEIDE